MILKAPPSPFPLGVPYFLTWVVVTKLLFYFVTDKRHNTGQRSQAPLCPPPLRVQPHLTFPQTRHHPDYPSKGEGAAAPHQPCPAHGLAEAPSSNLTAASGQNEPPPSAGLRT